MLKIKSIIQLWNMLYCNVYKFTLNLFLDILVVKTMKNLVTNSSIHVVRGLPLVFTRHMRPTAHLSSTSHGRMRLPHS